MMDKTSIDAQGSMLSVAGLTTRYGAIEAVRSVSLHVDEGEIVSVLGPNGAGKSTLLSSIMGLVRPAAGTVRFDGRDISGMDTEYIVRQGLGLVPERRRLFKNLTVRDNLLLGAAARQGRGDLAADKKAMLGLFPILEQRMDQLAGFLSGGEAQQLAIARALMGSPRMVLLDEPSLGLAPLLVEAVFDLIRGLRDRGFTILIVEQNAYQVLEFADRAYLLRNGEIALEGSSEELREERSLFSTYLGLETDAQSLPASGD